MLPREALQVELAASPAQGRALLVIGQKQRQLDREVLGIPEEKLLLPTHNRYHGAKVDNVAGQVALALCCIALLALPACEESSCAPAADARGG